MKLAMKLIALAIRSMVLAIGLTTLAIGSMVFAIGLTALATRPMPLVIGSMVLVTRPMALATEAGQPHAEPLLAERASFLDCGDNGFYVLSDTQ
ncbi:MAG: hypothetical protein R3B93_29460, partial [Bacteroidia bacterium]